MISLPLSPLYPTAGSRPLPAIKPLILPMYPQSQVAQLPYSSPQPLIPAASFSIPPAIAAPPVQTTNLQPQTPQNPEFTAPVSVNHSWLLPMAGIVGTALAGGILYKGISSGKKPEATSVETAVAASSANQAPNEAHPDGTGEQAVRSSGHIDYINSSTHTAESVATKAEHNLPKFITPANTARIGLLGIASCYTLPKVMRTAWTWWPSFQKSGATMPTAATRMASNLSSALPAIDSFKPFVSTAASTAQEALKPNPNQVAPAARQVANIASSVLAHALPSRSSLLGAAGVGLAGLGMYLVSKHAPQPGQVPDANHNANACNNHNLDNYIALFVNDPLISPQRARQLSQFIKNDHELLEFLTKFHATPRQSTRAEATQVMDKYVTQLLAQGRRRDSSPKNDIELVIHLLNTKARLSVPLQLRDGTLTLAAALRNNQIDLFDTTLHGMEPEDRALLLNKQDRLGQTALQIAVQNNNNHAAEALLKKGADPFVLDGQKKTVWENVWSLGQGHHLETLMNAYDAASLDCSKQLQLGNELSRVSKHRHEVVVQAPAGTVLRLNTENQPENSRVKAVPGDILQVNNALYKVTPELRLVHISSDAALTNYLFPKGLKDLHYKQGQIGDCAKLTQIHALLDDPSGVGTRALLERFSEDSKYIYLHSSSGTEKFRRSDILVDAQGNSVFKCKNNDNKPVSGPLGIQLLERGHYRDVRRAANRNSSSSGIQRSVAGTLHERNIKKDFVWSDDYGTGLLGQGFWLPYTQDGSVKTGLGTANSGLKQKERWGKGLTAPFGLRTTEEKKRIEDFLTQFEKNPASFRGIVGTKCDTGANAEVPISLLDTSEKLLTEHAYYFKRIIRNSSNQRVFQVIDPHNGSKTMNLSERDFMNNFYMFNGITPRVIAS